MFTVNEDAGMITIHPLFGGKSPYDLDYQIPIKQLTPDIRYSNAEGLQGYLKALHARVKEMFPMMDMEHRILSAFHAVCKEPKPHVMELGLTEDMLATMILGLLKTMQTLELELKQHKIRLVSFATTNDTYNGADSLFTVEDKNYKLASLKDVVFQLKALLSGEAEHVLLAENAGTVSMINRCYTNILYKPNEQKPTNKFLRWQYKSLAINQHIEDVVTLADTYKRKMDDCYGERQYNYKTGCLKIFKHKADGSIKKKKAAFNIKTLYPNLRADIRALKPVASDMMARHTGPNYFDWPYVDAVWRRFNAVKVELMLLGYTEGAATKFINGVAFKNKAIVKCEITKQLMPEVFAMPLKPLGSNTIIKANAYFVLSHNNTNDRGTGDRLTRYKPSDNGKHWYEVSTLTGYQKHQTSLCVHNKNALDLLTPMTAKGENVKPYSDDKGYRPTPYMGVELEVERKGTGQQEPDYQVIRDLEGNFRRIPIPGAMVTAVKECDKEINEKVLDLLGRDFVIIKHDGTLGGEYPFEIVTAPATLAVQKERWKPFMTNKETKEQLQSYASGHCGMHVHISRDSFTGLHLAKFMRLINCRENATFITKIAQRANNRYATYRPNASIMESANLILDNRGGGGHYQAVNTSNLKTVEVRIFRGNLAKGQFYKNLEFVHAVWSYTLTASMTQLDYKSFLFWLFDTKNNHHKQYVNLEKWLVAAGFSMPDSAVPKLPVVHRDLPPEEKAKLILLRKTIKSKYRDKQKTIALAKKRIDRSFLKKKSKIPMETAQELMQSA